VAHVAAASVTTAEFPKAGSSLTTPVKVVGFTNTFIGNGSPQIHTRPADANDDAAVFQSVLSRPDTVLVSQDFTPGARRGGGPGGGGTVTIGEPITVRDPVTGKTTTLTVAGIVSEAQYDGFDHVYLSQQTAQQVFGSRAVSNFALITTSANTNADQVAATINGRFLVNGANANSFRQLVSTQFSNNNSSSRSSRATSRWVCSSGSRASESS